jgi:hypothetical protein
MEHVHPRDKTSLSSPHTLFLSGLILAKTFSVRISDISAIKKTVTKLDIVCLNCRPILLEN